MCGPTARCWWHRRLTRRQRLRHAVSDCIARLANQSAKFGKPGSRSAAADGDSGTIAWHEWAQARNASTVGLVRQLRAYAARSSPARWAEPGNWSTRSHRRTWPRRRLPPGRTARRLPLQYSREIGMRQAQDSIQAAEGKRVRQGHTSLRLARLVGYAINVALRI